MTYKPPQRVLAARIRTSAGWMRASFHVPRAHSFVDHLASLPFFNVTQAALPGVDGPVYFLALRRGAVGAVAPDEESALQLTPLLGPTEKHRITCLLPWGAIAGELELLAKVRVSDYLLHHSGFICLRDAVAEDGEKLPVVLVNAAAVIGVSEPA